jgi:ATP-dependent helicase HrpB
MFGQIAIQQSRGAPDAEAAATMLADKALEAGVARFADPEEIEAWLGRLRFAAHHRAMAEPDMGEALRRLAFGLKSFTELEAACRHGGLLHSLESAMDGPSRRMLDEMAPEKIRLPGGRYLRVHYEAGQPPWIASRLQDFFGLQSTPTVAGGAVPVVIRLLAPNQRPVQTTTDLGGFWSRLYPQIRRELSRRYPKHKWPEDPTKVSLP